MSGKITIIINGEFYKKEIHHCLWRGDGSIARSNGPIINYIAFILKNKFEKDNYLSVSTYSLIYNATLQSLGIVC